MRKAAHHPPTPGQIAALRARLLAAKRRVLSHLGTVEEGIRAIGEGREAELEERAQVEIETGVFAQLGDEDFARFCEIESALDRIALKTYGWCTRCSTPIAVERLRADPSAALCSQCAKSRERGAEHGGSSEPTEAVTAGEGDLPPDLRVLDDAEIASLVHQCFREEVGEALREVGVVCRHGVVTLVGDIASEELRQVALRIVEDEMGLVAIDRLRVSGIAAETEEGADRLAGLPMNELAVDITGGDSVSDDIFAVEEDGLTYTPPARPVAETE